MSTLRRCSDLVENENTNKNENYMDFKTLERPVEGMRLAVVPFLSNNGMTTSLVRCCSGDLVGLNVVLRKHLVICCVSLPIPTGFGHYLSSIMDAYFDLPRHKFEVVLVASSDSDQAVFNDFSSKLPCLAVPFSDVDTRHHICTFIGTRSFCPYLAAILVDPEETLTLYEATLAQFVSFGSEWFPFRDSDADAIRVQDLVTRFRLDPFYRKSLDAPEAVLRDPLLNEPLSLYSDILCCDPNLRIPRIGSVDESITVLELSKKHVGLYMCFERLFLPNLIQTYKECIEKNQELEILVIYVPLFDFTNSNLELLYKKLRSENVTSWLLFPTHYKVWRRLSRAFGLEYCEDRLIILPPNGRPGELEGRGIIEEMGITEYPFTKTSILERRFAFLRSLTPALLFKGAPRNRTCLVRKGKTFNVRQSSLQGKRLLVYLDWSNLSDDGGKLCCRLMELYPEIKARGWEVVFVPLDREHEVRRRHVNLDYMLWPVMPLRIAWQAGVRHKFILGDDEDGHDNLLVAFREDGKIVSREVKKRLMEHGLDDSLFNDHLYEEITDDLVGFTR